MDSTVLIGDCRDVLKTLPDESVQCCVTSPPYWGLRDYGHPDQIGQEPTPDAFVASLVQVFREVRRVLRKDGTLWLNLGDSYSAQCSGGHGYNDGRTNRSERKGPGLVSGMKPKDLVGIPWMVAFALRADGWYLRQDIIWHKPNPMPESVTDRCTKAHEYLFLLSKSSSYYCDMDAIKEPASNGDWSGRLENTSRKSEPDELKNGIRNGRASGNKTHKLVTEYEASDSEEHRTKAGLLKITDTAYAKRNKRSVWTIPTKPYPEAHFATFPPDLIRPCILAGSKAGDTVLDPFGGSGTTGMVALELWRKPVLIELNPAYAPLIDARLDTQYGRLAL